MPANKEQSQSKTNNPEEYSVKFLKSGKAFIRKCDQGYSNEKLVFRLSSTINYFFLVYL